MKKSLLIIACLVCISFFSESTGYHPLKISMTEIQLSPTTHSLQVSIRIFVDDFQETLVQTTGNYKLDLTDVADSTNLKKEMGTYLLKHFSLATNDGPIKLLLKKYVHDDLVIWYYLEGTLNGAPQALAIENTLLTDVFKVQKNIVYIEGMGSDRTLQFSADKTHERITL